MQDIMLSGIFSTNLALFFMKYLVFDISATVADNEL